MAITHIHQEVSAKLLKEGKLFPEIFQATMQRIEKQENIVLNIPDILKELESYRLVAVSLPKGSKTENNNKDFYATIHPDVYLSESAYQEGFLFEILYLDRNKNKNHSERGYLKKDNTAKRATISIDVEETWVNPDLMNVDEGSFYDYPEHPKSYLFQELLDRRLVGKNMAFRFAQRPVHLRYDDADSFLQAVNDMIDEGHNKAHFYAPVLFLNTENKEIIQEYAEELASFVAIYIDDPEFHEELEASLPEYSFIQLPDSNCGVIIFPDKATLELDLNNTNSLNDAKTAVFSYYSNIDESNIWTTKSRNFYWSAQENMVNTKKELERRITDLKNENLKLKIQNQTETPIAPIASPAIVPIVNKPKIKIDTSGKMFNHGKIKDFYDDEVREIILECLEEYRSKYTSEGSRRADVLDSFLSANPKTGILDKKRQAITEAMKEFEGNTPSSINALKSAGLTIKSRKNHIKGYWFEEKYNFTLASSPSDYSSNKNGEMVMIKKFF